MNKYKSLILTLIAAAMALAATAQTDPQMGQFYRVKSQYNPAAVGLDDYININGGARLQWVGIDGAPQSFVSTADMPFKFLGKRFGTGVVLRQETIGLFSSINAAAQLAFKMRKFGGEFTAGVQFGLFNQKFKGSEVFLPDGDDFHQGNDDAIPTQDINGNALDIAAGLWYQRPRWGVGVSMTHITGPTIKMGGENSGTGTSTTEQIYEFKADRTLYLIGECNIPIKNTLFEILPALLVKTDFTFYTGELTARARYNKFLSFGLGYRWDDAVIATVAAELKNFYLGYSYEYSTGAIHSASSGSHEFVIGYRLKLNLGEKNKNRHRSIRIM